jgi:lipopolysaccharide/colanic/teichoic acid biosynthesis glycosyltransferase
MFYDIIKRIIDVVGAIVLLIIFSPVMFITAILIKATSRGPVLVEKTNRHMKRVGKDGKLFRLYKFRSMMVRADKLLETDPKYRAAHIERHTKGNYKIMNDPRTTKIGRFIRKYSIDETPQFFNVLLGDMSIVGPRPYLPDELAEQTEKFPGTDVYVKKMHKVKPGITGYWQVSGRSDVKFDKRIAMDAYYAEKKSIWLDILILLKTPWAMLTGRGAA